MHVVNKCGGTYFVPLLRRLSRIELYPERGWKRIMLKTSPFFVSVRIVVSRVDRKKKKTKHQDKRNTISTNIYVSFRQYPTDVVEFFSKKLFLVVRNRVKNSKTARYKAITSCSLRAYGIVVMATECRVTNWRGKSRWKVFHNDDRVQ